MTMKAIFVCERLPSLGFSGAQSYNLNIINALLDCGYEVTVIITGDYFPAIFSSKYEIKHPQVKTKYVNAVKIFSIYLSKSWRSFLRPLKKISYLFFDSHSPQKKMTIGKFLSKRDTNSTKKLITKECSLVVVDTIFRSAIIDELSSKKILIAHDVFFDRTKSFQKRGYEVSPSITKDKEIGIWKEFDCIAAINIEEMDLISSLIKNKSVVTIYPSVSNNTYPALRTYNGSSILYIGANANHNVDGLKWFFNEVWPTILKQHPNIHLNIIGSVCDAFQSPPENVNFLGRLDSIEEIAKDCLFAINPVLMGSGIKIKILDYLALGLPTITTKEGGYGYPKGDHVPYICVSTASEYINAISSWIGDRKLVTERAEYCSAVLEIFTRKSAAKSMAGCFKKLGLNSDTDTI